MRLAKRLVLPKAPPNVPGTGVVRAPHLKYRQRGSQAVASDVAFRELHKLVSVRDAVSPSLTSEIRRQLPSFRQLLRNTASSDRPLLIRA